MAQQTDNMAVMENRLMTITGLMGQRINNFSARLSRLHPFGQYVASWTVYTCNISTSIVNISNKKLRRYVQMLTCSSN